MEEKKNNDKNIRRKNEIKDNSVENNKENPKVENPTSNEDDILPIEPEQKMSENKDLKKNDIGENKEESVKKIKNQDAEEQVNKEPKVEQTKQVQNEKQKTENIKKSKQDSNTKNKTKTKKMKKEEKRKQKSLQKEQKLKLRQEKAMKNIRWFWFFILLLLAIILLFMWDNHKKTRFMKSQLDTISSLRNSEFFYKSKYLEEDSTLTSLLNEYNELLSKNLKNNKEIDQKTEELLKLQKQLFVQDSILRQVKSSLEVATSGFDQNQINVELKNGKLYFTMRNKLLFSSGSDQVQPSGLKVLRAVAAVLKKNPNIEILIEGHTDNVPIDPKNKKFRDNWDLSTARAVSVTRILVSKYKIRPERLSAAGRSMYYPVAPNTTAAGRAQNRRIEIIMTPNLEEVYKILDSTTTK